MAKVLEYNARVVQRVDHTPDLSSFITRQDEPLDGDPAFVPGQYVAIGLNNTARPELGSVRRAMSITSAPEEVGVLEFYVRRVSKPASENPLTHILWELEEGDRLFVSRKPVGRFTLEDTINRPEALKVLVAAGTGIAPFVSMVRSRRLSSKTPDMRDLVLLHGASYPEDLVYRQELEDAASRFGLQYFSTISRPSEAKDWQGAVGRVEDFFLPQRLEALETKLVQGAGALKPGRAGVLVCGLQGTIAESIKRLAARGFMPHDRKIRGALELEHPASLWWEQYDNEPVIDLEDVDLISSLRDQIRSHHI